MYNTKNQGFTLIELSIVLVIIGLIVGGVLVGQDLIKGAEIRATVSQMEKFNAASNTFRGKYNALPGDMATAATFGLDATGAGTAAGLGNGNGLIEASHATAVIGFTGETRMFWRHLAQANMIGDPIAAADYTAATVVTVGDTNMPLAKMGKGNRFHMATVGGLNYFVLAGFTGATTAAGQFATAPADDLTPQEAFQIDSKLDDGVPNSGIVRATTILAAAAAASQPAAGEASPSDAGVAYASIAAGDCWIVSGTNLNTYATSVAVAQNSNGCQLRIRTSF